MKLSCMLPCWALKLQATVAAGSRGWAALSLSLGAPTPGSSAPRAPVLLFTSSSCTVVAWLEGSFLKDAALSVTLTHYTSGSSSLVREMLTAEGCINWAVGDMEYGCCNYLLRGQRRRKNFP